MALRTMSNIDFVEGEGVWKLGFIEILVLVSLSWWKFILDQFVGFLARFPF